MIIAIDGPAGSGKGTLAKELARIYRMKYLDTGTLYRVVGLNVVNASGNPAKEEDAIKACNLEGFDFRHIGNNQFAVFMNGEDITTDIRSPGSGQAASKVSFFPSVRKELKDFQVNFAKVWGNRCGVILDGRDIGTVICPNADFKFFLDAKAQVRANRRRDELVRKGFMVNYQEILADILERDARDKGRDTAPLKAASDAVIIDTSTMTIDNVIAKVVSIIGESGTKAVI